LIVFLFRSGRHLHDLQPASRIKKKKIGREVFLHAAVFRIGFYLKIGFIEISDSIQISSPDDNKLD